MNLTKLFQMQKDLDERIVREKGLEGQDLLPQKILALQVELGELANEWRGFKFWSADQKTRINLMEEFVDCLHFILSIGLELKRTTGKSIQPDACRSLIKQFNNVFGSVFVLNHNIEHDHAPEFSYDSLFSKFLGLGEMLGFTWEHIEAAYIDKNAVNHERQTVGY